MNICVVKAKQHNFIIEYSKIHKINVTVFAHREYGGKKNTLKLCFWRSVRNRAIISWMIIMR